MLLLDLGTGELIGEDVADVKYEGNPYNEVEPQTDLTKKETEFLAFIAKEC